MTSLLCHLYLANKCPPQVITNIENAGELWVRGPTVMKVCDFGPLNPAHTHTGFTARVT